MQCKHYYTTVARNGDYSHQCGRGLKEFLSGNDVRSQNRTLAEQSGAKCQARKCFRHEQAPFITHWALSDVSPTQLTTVSASNFHF